MGLGRILKDTFLRRSVRELYWNWCDVGGLVSRLFQSPNNGFCRIVVLDQLRFCFGAVRPIEGETWERAQAAAAWLVRAQAATPDDGVSHGFFPCEKNSGWATSYPETTGYIIPSLLQFARMDRSELCRDRALRMARWEADIQMPSGAVQGGCVCAPELRTACAFNTGMVLDGLSAAYRASGDPLFVEAGRRAGEFLVNDLSPEGYFLTNGAFVTNTGIKTYNVLCAWAMYRLGQDLEDDRYCQAAVRIVQAGLKQQRSNGWFANNCLTRPDAPLSHTICYTLQGILEVGILAKREEFVAAAIRGVEPILTCVSKEGFLNGRYYPDWQPAAMSSCLTGSAQLAVICYRLYEHTGDARYRLVADRLVNYLKALQVLESSVEGVNGALAGSFPLFGSYMTGGYPNWATKYFLDALMWQEQLRSRSAGQTQKMSTVTDQVRGKEGQLSMGHQ